MDNNYGCNQKYISFVKLVEHICINNYKISPDNLAHPPIGIPGTCDCQAPRDINECCCRDKDGDPCCTTECSLKVGPTIPPGNHLVLSIYIYI